MHTVATTLGDEHCGQRLSKFAFANTPVCRELSAIISVSGVFRESIPMFKHQRQIQERKATLGLSVTSQ